ncbi:MAG: universal stress protein [Acidimicrobiales bacterium]|jgi:nucleotide-binding universal stress UspA family protein|nr:universal stress protein [Acidimicrobiales bacterium]
MGRIVVGVDGSEGARRALRFAAEEARLRGATLEVVMVWQYPTMTTMPVYGVLPPAEEMETSARATVRKIMADEGLDSTSDPVAVEIVAEGPPAKTLSTAATGADLLVVGSRGHGGFTGLLLGSVSHHCVSHATCPVVVVPIPHD